LVSLLQSTNDWASYAGAYSLYNILQVTVHFYPEAHDITVGHDSAIGICYDPKDATTALASLGAVSDHLQFKMFHGQINALPEVLFRFKPKPNAFVPNPVSSATEVYGAIKGFADDTTFGISNSIGNMVVTFTVAFTSPE
jgi:hypothetical protein